MVVNSGKFTAQFAKWTAKSNERADNFFKLVALEAFTILLRRSPVDTGAFRGNWRASVSNKGSLAADTTADINDRSNAVFGAVPTFEELARILSVVEKAKFGQIISLTENLKYALILERGRSKGMAPTGVLQLSFLELQAKLPALLEASKGRR